MLTRFSGVGQKMVGKITCLATLQVKFEIHVKKFSRPKKQLYCSGLVVLEPTLSKFRREKKKKKIQIIVAATKNMGVRWISYLDRTGHCEEISFSSNVVNYFNLFSCRLIIRRPQYQKKLKTIRRHEILIFIGPVEKKYIFKFGILLEAGWAPRNSWNSFKI